MSGIAERLTEVLHVHLCGGTDHAYAAKTPFCHMLAQVLLPVVEREIAAARGEALWEAADDPALRLSGHSGVSVTGLRKRAAALSPDPDRGEGEGK